MRRKQVSFNVLRCRKGDDETVRITVRNPSGSEQTYDSLEEVPDGYRAIVEPFFRAESLPDPNVQPTCQRRTPRPKRVRSRQGENDLEIAYYWLDIMAAIGGAIVAGFSFWWTNKLIAGQWWILLPFPLAGCMLGIYWTLTFLINRTMLRADDRGLDIRHGPLFWPGSRFIPRQDIEQLFVSIHPRRYGFTYRLQAFLPHGNVVLVRDIRAPEEARSMERAIERRLGIKDRPVPGPQYR